MKKNVGISYKAFAGILAAVLILGGAIGGTMAWLIDGTDAVANVFTDSDINITLVEEAKNKPDAFKMIPGHTITKDPKVTVEAGSEDCYLFVKIDKSENYGTYLDEYTIADGWTSLKDAEDNIVDGVYYREVTKDTPEKTFPVLKDNQVTVLDSVTKKMMDAIDGKDENGNDAQAEIANRPTLTFKAYAVQLYKTNPNPEDPNASKFDVTDAWEQAQENEESTTTN